MSIEQLVLEAKRAGLSDAEIGRRFGLSLRRIERIVTESVGVNVSDLSCRRRIRRWEPADFHMEDTTVWSFPQRGDWATHNARYRGNWSPFIPRNLILRYTLPGDLVLDPFSGGGTTAIEAKLLGRRCIALDINPAAVQLTLENLQFTPPANLFDETVIHEPQVSVGDARCMDIPNDSVDLVCAHPPYADIIRYTSDIEGDLSHLEYHSFLREMQSVAGECYRVLKPGGKCAVLIGDMRRNRRVLPLGFDLISVFLNAGFVLSELVIKRQHHCKTTGFWTKRSVEHNFLLLAHEYLPVFEKPVGNRPKDEITMDGVPTNEIPMRFSPRVLSGAVNDELLQTTSVWMAQGCVEDMVTTNLKLRYGIDRIININDVGLQDLTDGVCRDGYTAFEVSDIRRDTLFPTALAVIDRMRSCEGSVLKEIVVVVTDAEDGDGTGLRPSHRYLLIYE